LAKAEFSKKEYEELQYELIEAGIMPAPGIIHHLAAQKIFSDDKDGLEYILNETQIESYDDYKQMLQKAHRSADEYRMLS
jgi:hypothetical protein